MFALLWLICLWVVKYVYNELLDRKMQINNLTASLSFKLKLFVLYSNIGLMEADGSAAV